MSKIPKNPAGMTFNNNKIYITAETGMHSGVGFTGAYGAIPTGGPSFGQMEVAPKYGYGSHILWDATLEAIKGGTGSLADVLTKFGTSLTKAFDRSVNRQMFGNGQGVLTLINGAGSATATHTVDSTFYLAPGMNLLVGTKAQIEAGTADSVVVSTVNSDTSVTFTTSITSADNDLIVTKGVYTAGTSAYEEIMGLGMLVSNNTENAGSSFQGKLRSTNAWANSYVDSTSAVLTEAQIISMVTQATKYGDPDLIMTTPDLSNKYASLLSTNRRQVNTLDLAGGFKGLEVSIGNKPLAMVQDWDCPTGNMFCLDTATWGFAELAPLSYLDNGMGGMLTTVVDADGKRIPGYQVTMKLYGNLCGTTPRANAKLTNKTAS
ncbi:phage major capsid protein [Candidatus Gracilibacteria bacterium]|nr:phage major capsid protein [Candidatus Gracilibacteria bacterium]